MLDSNKINITSEPRGNGGTRASGLERSLPSLANGNLQNQANLMTKVASIANLNLAFKAVKRNKGAPGIDNITISQLEENLNEHLSLLQTSLIE